MVTASVYVVSSGVCWGLHTDLIYFSVLLSGQQLSRVEEEESVANSFAQDHMLESDWAGSGLASQFLSLSALSLCTIPHGLLHCGLGPALERP